MYEENSFLSVNAKRIVGIMRPYENRKNRHLAILYTLVKSQDDFISSEELAEKTMSSIRTVKSDISMLNNVLKAEHIGSIESRRTGEHGSVRVLSAYTERNTLHSRLHCRRK